MPGNFEFSVVPYSACADEIIAFRNRNRSIARDTRYFQWRYVDRPCGHDALIVWGVNEHGDKVASASVIPHDFHVIDAVHPVGMLGDISVLPECRGHRVATRMLEYLVGHPAVQRLRGCFVLPNEEAGKSLERAHWMDAAAIERHVRIIDIGPRLRARFGNTPPVALAARGVNLALHLFADLRSSRQRPDVELRESGGFGPRFDALWDAVPKAGKVLAVRDAQYLRWRYADHPAMPYRVFEYGSADRLIGYAVLHIAEDMVVVDDFLAMDSPSLHAMLYSLVQRARTERWAAGFQVRCAGTSLFSPRLRGLGFVRRNDTQRVMTNPAFAAERPAIPTDSAVWFVTAGDKDV